MKTAARALTVALGLLFAASAFAEAPAPVVKASTPAVAVSKAAATPAAKTSAEAPKKAAVEAAPGGGNGKVWVNNKSKVYHCEGTEHYGKTKDGEYLPEADAKAKGNKANGGKACSAAKEAAKDVKPAKEAKEVKKVEKTEKAEKTEKPASK